MTTGFSLRTVRELLVAIIDPTNLRHDMRTGTSKLMVSDVWIRCAAMTLDDLNRVLGDEPAPDRLDLPPDYHVALDACIAGDPTLIDRWARSRCSGDEPPADMQAWMNDGRVYFDSSTWVASHPGHTSHPHHPTMAVWVHGQWSIIQLGTGDVSWRGVSQAHPATGWSRPGRRPVGWAHLDSGQRADAIRCFDEVVRMGGGGDPPDGWADGWDDAADDGWAQHLRITAMDGTSRTACGLYANNDLSCVEWGNDGEVSCSECRAFMG